MHIFIFINEDGDVDDKCDGGGNEDAEPSCAYIYMHKLTKRIDPGTKIESEWLHVQLAICNMCYYKSIDHHYALSHIDHGALHMKYHTHMSLLARSFVRTYVRSIPIFGSHNRPEKRASDRIPLFWILCS